MAHLIDTNILVRLANANDVQHAVAVPSVLELHRRGEVLHLTPQVLIEFRNVATRPVARNGLGFSTATAEAEALVTRRSSLCWRRRPTSFLHGRPLFLHWE